MDFLEITGGSRISGKVDISGAKNSVLPLLASTILSKNIVMIDNAPMVKDVLTLLKLLENLGASFSFKENNITINSTSIKETIAVYDIVKTMRASVLVLGPLLARFGYCEVSLPGGCAIGQRPIDLHIKALELMGAKIELKDGYLIASAKNGLSGAAIVFDKITVTGTENIIMAAALAHGKTKIINAAKEPEVIQLCEVLQASGVEIKGIGTDEITIWGTDRELLDMNSISVIPDRIEAATYLCVGAIANSKLTINRANANHLDAILLKLEEMGFSFEIDDDSITINPAKIIRPVNIITTEYPGFPTDVQAQFMALATQAEGTSVIEEKLFENRLMHVSELKRMGAKITLNKNIATIRGKTILNGTDVMATDLRASSALVLAAIVANGKTNIHRIYHLDRGYEKLEEKLKAIGLSIERKKE